MYRTIQVSSCVSVQGDFVELLANGDMLIRDGRHVYRGRPVANGVPAPRPKGLPILARLLTPRRQDEA